MREALLRLVAVVPLGILMFLFLAPSYCRDCLNGPLCGCFSTFGNRVDEDGTGLALALGVLSTLLVWAGWESFVRARRGRSVLPH